MAKSADSEYAKKVRELRDLHGMTQEEFARKIGVTQPTVSSWERGADGDDPSSAAYVLLAGVSPPDLAFWFLEKAGLKRARAKVRLLAEEDMKARNAAPVAESVKLLLLSIDGFAHGDHEGAFAQMRAKIDAGAGLYVPFPSGTVRDRGATICVRAPDDYMRPLFRKGDFVAVRMYDTPIPLDPSHPEIKELAKSASTTPTLVAGYHRLGAGDPARSGEGSFQFKRIRFSPTGGAGSPSPGTGADGRPRYAPPNLYGAIDFGTQIGDAVRASLSGDPEVWQYQSRLSPLVGKDQDMLRFTVTGNSTWSIFGKVVAWVGTADPETEASVETPKKD